MNPYLFIQKSELSFEFTTSEGIVYNATFCDSSDDRHLAGKRKFDFWFWKYNDGTIIKEDGLAVVAGVEIYNSLLLLRSNPNAMLIIEAFRTLNERADDK